MSTIEDNFRMVEGEGYLELRHACACAYFPWTDRVHIRIHNHWMLLSPRVDKTGTGRVPWTVAGIS